MFLETNLSLRIHQRLQGGTEFKVVHFVLTNLCFKRLTSTLNPRKAMQTKTWWNKHSAFFFLLHEVFHVRTLARTLAAWEWWPPFSALMNNKLFGDDLAWCMNNFSGGDAFQPQLVSRLPWRPAEDGLRLLTFRCDASAILSHLVTV